MKERQVKAMLIIKNCNLINMAGIYKEKKDLVVKDGKVLDICDDACQKYGQGNVIIDACGNYVTPGIVEPHCSLGVKEEVFRFEGNDADETTDPIVPQVRAMDAINPRDEGFKMALAGGHSRYLSGQCKPHRRNLRSHQDHWQYGGGDGHGARDRH